MLANQSEGHLSVKSMAASMPNALAGLWMLAEAAAFIPPHLFFFQQIKKEKK